MDLPRPLSNSSLNLYAECPQKYKFKYIDKIPEKPRHFFSFGSSVHQALEFFYSVKALPVPSLKELLAYYKEHWISAGYKDKLKEQEYFEDGLEILQKFWEKHHEDGVLPFFIEYRFDLEIDGVPITGRIDRIDKLTDGTLSILDYKTGKKLSEDKIQNDAQLTLYQIACEKLLNMKVARLAFYHLPSLTEHTTPPRSETQVGKLSRQIVTTAQSICKGLFDPAPEERKCYWCDYKPLCPVFKNQYPQGTTAALEPDSELTQLIDQYGSLLVQEQTLEQQKEEVKTAILNLMNIQGYARAFGQKFEARRTVLEKWEYLDKKKVLDLLTASGLYEKILAPSAPKVEKLLEDSALDGRLKGQLSALAEKIQTQDLKITPI